MTGYTAPKLLWMAEHAPQQLSSAAHLLFPKDFVTWTLTGERVTDYSDASNSLLLDLHEATWSTSLVDALGIDLPAMPPLAESAQTVGSVSRSGADWSGLTAGTPVAAGAGDSIAAALGDGMNGPDVIQVVVGSAGNVNCVMDRLLIDAKGRVHTGFFTDRRHFICSAVQQSAGASLKWWSNVTGVDPGTLVKEIDAAAEPTVYFGPYLCGERTPHLDPDLRGAFVNLNQHTSRGDMTRAILEGVAFSFRDAFDVFAEMGVAPRRASVSGGGGGSRVWRDIIGAVLGMPIIMGAEDTTARGAAMLAACAAARFDGWEEAIAGWAQESETATPAPELVDRYRAAHERFRRLHPSLSNWRGRGERTTDEHG